MAERGTLQIPGVGEWTLRNIVFDYNGTLATGGVMQEEVRNTLIALTKYFDVYVITADTYGTVKAVLENTSVKLKTLEKQPGYLEKKAFVEALDAQATVAVGNGRNDREMLKAARLGIAVIGREGAAIEALQNADVVVQNIMDAMGMMQNPTALIATLRD